MERGCVCVCGLKWDVCEWLNLFNRRRTILAWPCSTARQRAGLEKSLIGKKCQKNVDTTWNHPRVGSWCLSRGHCQGGLWEQQSHQPWRIMATNPTSSLRAIDYILQSLPLEMHVAVPHQVLPCTRAAATSSTTWSPPELLSAAATSVARPPFWSHTWNSQTYGESLMVIVFLMYEVGLLQPYLWGVVMHTKLSPALCWLGPWSAV